MSNTKLISVPCEVAEALQKFIEAQCTGNVTLNIKDGQILAAHVSEIISVKPADKPAVINGEQRRKTCPKRI